MKRLFSLIILALAWNNCAHLAAQIISAESYPVLPYPAHQETIIPGRNNVFFAVGSARNQQTLFDNTYGSILYYYFRHDSGGTYPLVMLPDTDYFMQAPFNTQEDEIASTFAVNSENTPFVAWSKRRTYWEDYGPFISYATGHSTKIVQEVHGKLSNMVEYANAVNPSVACADDFEGPHIVFEQLTPLDTIKSGSPGSGSFRFTHYVSTIYHDVPYTMRVPPVTKTEIGRGFQPQIKKGFDNRLHLLYFDSDSSNASRFELNYRRAISPTRFDSARVLASLDRIPGVSTGDLGMPQLQWNVDSSGMLYVIWNTYHTVYALRYSDLTGVQVDSSSYIEVQDLDALFTPNGARAIWRVLCGSQVADDLYFMQLSDNKMLRWEKTQSLSTQETMAQLLLDTSGTQYLIRSDRLFPSFYVTENFATGHDTLFIFRGRYHRSTPAFFDSNNRIWFGGQKDSTPVLVNFNIDDLGKSPITFPLHIGDEWQYLEYPEGGWYPELEIVKARHDTMMANGKIYTELFSRQYQTKYFRNEPPKVFQYSVKDSSEYLRFDFSGSVGDTIARNGLGSAARPIVITNIDLYNSNYVQFNFLGSILSSQGDDWFCRVADSIGITYFSSGVGPWSVLSGANIAGKVYGTIVSVGGPKKSVPEEYSLSQNYPNPFNPVTTIKYRLPINSPVTLKVYDILGRELMTLVNEVQTAGNYSVQFTGSQYSSGIYCYRLQAGEFSNAKLMLMLK